MRNEKKQVWGRFVKDTLVVCHDLSAAWIGCVFSFLFVFPFDLILSSMHIVIKFSAIHTLISLLVSWYIGVFSTLWRIASLLDFVALIRVHSIVLCVALSARMIYHISEPEPLFYAEVRVFIGASIFALGIQCLGRVVFRYIRHLIRNSGAVSRYTRSSLLVGTIGEVEGFIRLCEQGPYRTEIVGALLLAGGRNILNIRGVRIFGDTNDFEEALKAVRAGGLDVDTVIISPALLGRLEELRRLRAVAMRLGISIRKFDSVEFGAQSEVSFEDLLFRDTHSVPSSFLERAVLGKRILITGGGGSIGGEIAIRSAAFGALEIILCDISELGLQTRCLEIRRDYPNCVVKPILSDVRDYCEVLDICVNTVPDILVHAAALKHLDLVEEHWTEAIKTNVFGTFNVLRAAYEADIKILVNISTDKAVDPTSILGLTKQCGEALVKFLPSPTGSFWHSVRFGNVLGSSGSVSTIFLSQIARGGPLTITHPDVVRYFMTAREACELVLATCGLAEDGHDTFVLNMGEQIPIYQLACQLIEWSGLSVGTDIDVIFTGLRAGERLEEKLVGDNEICEKTEIAGIERVISSEITGQLGDEFIAALGLEVSRKNRVGAINLLNGIYVPLSGKMSDASAGSR